MVLMLELIAALSLVYMVAFILLAGVVTVVSGMLFRARRAARIVEAADVPAVPSPDESAVDASVGRAAT